MRLIQPYPPDINHINWPKIARALAERGGFALGDLDQIIFTQVRLPSIKLVMEDLGLPLSKTHWIMEEWGYMGSACIPCAWMTPSRRARSSRATWWRWSAPAWVTTMLGAALRMP